MKKFNPIIIVAGEPNSVFLEILFKSVNQIKIKSPIILIASEKLVNLQMRVLKFKIKINKIDKNFNLNEINNKCINLIDVNYKTLKAFEKITSKSNLYINNCFKTAFLILKKYNLKKFINGPINKQTFLNKNYLGITEYISSYFNIKNVAMLIYNKRLSVCPVTTHLPLKLVAKKINKKVIINKIKLIYSFYKKEINKKPRIAVLGLNPHCETTDNFDEDNKIIKPAIKDLKNQKFKIYGPFSADTIFLSQNRTKYDVILGMYHDQVLTPLKTLFEYDAINITIGLPFVRISPDHGPNETMLGKNLSNPFSLIQAVKFLDKN